MAHDLKIARSARLGTSSRIALATGLAALVSGCASWRVDKAAQVVTGYSSHLLCDDIFISGIDPAASFAERVKPIPGLGLVHWAMHHEVDPVRRQVTVSIAGAFRSRAQHRGVLGCMTLPASDVDVDVGPVSPPPLVEPSLPDVAGPDIVIPADLRLRLALERAVPGREQAPRHGTKAIVVMRGGKVIGERYAHGHGVDTPVAGFSMTKSVTNALIGILVRQGRLRPDHSAPVPAWSHISDPRRAITIEHLLRQTSGLDIVQDNSGFDASSHIMYTARDKAATAAGATLSAVPGTRWAYTDGNYLLLSRIVRDAAGGTASDVLRLAQTELFGPLGMRRVTLDFDTTGTPVGASHMLASPRDWARFGQLYLQDGVIGGRRILPEGWVRQSTIPTLATGYGAGFWTNRVTGNVADWGVPWGLSTAPRDTFFARGLMGQYVVVIPSERLVIVRSSVSHVRGDDIGETDRIVGDILAALRDM